MNRSEFLKKCAVLGIGLPFLSSMLSSCDKETEFFEDINVNFSGTVLVIGAGAAGLCAGHMLNKYGIDFQILEASSDFGGRVRGLEGFADFPIDLGAEWIHDKPSVVARLLNDPNSTATLDAMVYNPQTIYFWNGERLKKLNTGTNFYSEYKWKSSTWYDFFDTHIVPGISDRIQYNRPVTEIDYSGSQVLVRTGGVNATADKVLITVPLSILQSGSIAFTPDLPSDKRAALDDAYLPPGIKIFVEFSERFYPDVITDTSRGTANTDEKTIYDAAFRKGSDRNILGLFSIGEPARYFTDMATEQEIIDAFLAELDAMFEGRASATYVKHVIQNWSAEPYVQGSYNFFENNSNQHERNLRTPIDNKLFFAGEAVSELSSATVHGAGDSGFVGVRQMLEG